MKIPIVKPDTENPETLRRQLITIQENINRAFDNVGYTYSERLSFQFRCEEFPKLISHRLPRPVFGLKPVYLRNLSDDAAYPTDGMYIDWIPESGGIKIRGINGLLPSQIYQIELLVYA